MFKLETVVVVKSLGVGSNAFKFLENIHSFGYSSEPWCRRRHRVLKSWSPLIGSLSHPRQPFHGLLRPSRVCEESEDLPPLCHRGWRSTAAARLRRSSRRSNPPPMFRPVARFRERPSTDPLLSRGPLRSSRSHPPGRSKPPA